MYAIDEVVFIIIGNWPWVSQGVNQRSPIIFSKEYFMCNKPFTDTFEQCALTNICHQFLLPRAPLDPACSFRPRSY